MNFLKPYFISIVIGLLVGIERERAQPKLKAIGVRTFILIALLGAVAGGLENPWMSVVIAAFVLGSILVSYYLFAAADSQDHGLTTEFAAAVVFAISYYSHQNPALAAILGPLVALVLFFKNRIHHFSAHIRPAELQATLLILLLAVNVVGLLEDRAIDSWGIFNPRRFGLIVLIIAALEFLGYLIAKFWGEKRSSLIVGFLGGFVSSTAVLMTSARLAKGTKALANSLATSVLAAKLAALIELLAIVALASPALATHLALPIVAGILIGGITLAIYWQKDEKAHTKIQPRSPLEIWAVLRLALLLAFILAVIAVAQRFLGKDITIGLMFLTGLFELHGLSLATATLFASGALDVESAVSGIVLATAASLIAKIALAWFIAGGDFARRVTAFLGIIGLAIGGAWWFLP